MDLLTYDNSKTLFEDAEEQEDLDLWLEDNEVRVHGVELSRKDFDWFKDAIDLADRFIYKHMGLTAPFRDSGAWFALEHQNSWDWATVETRKVIDQEGYSCVEMTGVYRGVILTSPDPRTIVVRPNMEVPMLTNLFGHSFADYEGVMQWQPPQELVDLWAIFAHECNLFNRSHSASSLLERYTVEPLYWDNFGRMEKDWTHSALRAMEAYLEEVNDPDFEERHAAALENNEGYFFAFSVGQAFQAERDRDAARQWRDGVYRYGWD